MPHLPTASLVLVAAVLAAAGCSKANGNAAGNAPAAKNAPSVLIDDASRKEAGEIFATRCTVCHGPEGGGNGPASAGLSPHPRNFQDGTWQQSVTDEHVEKIVQYGGAAVGKSPAMPPNPDLMARPAVVAALREKVRSFGQK
jgi:mono/diheme cytochrome c family protein